MTTNSLRSWKDVPLALKIIALVCTVFLSGGTAAALTQDFVGLPAKVKALEHSDAEQSTMLQFLVCAERTDSSDGCEFILEETDGVIR